MLIYGDIYKEGNKKWSASVEIGIGEVALTSITLSIGSAYLRYVSSQRDYYACGLSE